jgi:hypothetical protein
MRGRKLGRDKIEKFLENLGMTGSVLRAAAAAKASRNTFYCLRASDPRFREAWDQALERGLDALEDSLFERGAAGDTTAAIFLLKKRRPHIYGDQPKTLTQNLSVRLMSPEQREEEARQILERIAALGHEIPPEYVTIDVPDAEFEGSEPGARLREE